jgi:hypothetical protein
MLTTEQQFAPITTEAATVSALADFETRTGLDRHIAALDLDTPSSREHVQRMGTVLGRWAVRAGFSGDALVEIVCSARAHDIGKVSVASLIESSRILNDEERRLVADHPRIGADSYAHEPVHSWDRDTKRQVVAQILLHHTRHDAELARDTFKDLEGADLAVRPAELHTLIRAGDMIEALGSLNRAYMRTRVRNKSAKWLRYAADAGGTFVFKRDVLMAMVLRDLGLSGETAVLGRPLETVIDELAGLAPPVLPERTAYDPRRRLFISKITGERI